jgi:hypothetical protein
MSYRLLHKFLLSNLQLCEKAKYKNLKNEKTKRHLFIRVFCIFAFWRKRSENTTWRKSATIISVSVSVYIDDLKNIGKCYFCNINHVLHYNLKLYLSFALLNFIHKICLFVFGFTSHRHSIGHVATFQLYWWKKTSGAPPCIISGTNGHLSRTTDVP